MTGRARSTARYVYRAGALPQGFPVVGRTGRRHDVSEDAARIAEGTEPARAAFGRGRGSDLGYRFAFSRHEQGTACPFDAVEAGKAGCLEGRDIHPVHGDRIVPWSMTMVNLTLEEVKHVVATMPASSDVDAATVRSWRLH